MSLASKTTLLPLITSTVEPTGTGACFTMKTSSPLPLLANFIEPPIGLLSILAIEAPNIIVVVYTGHV